MARRRSPRVHERILEAALDLFTERGILGTSMDAIAEHAGVSKATVYNHWADKDALCLEALARLHGLDETSPTFDTGDLRADLAALLAYRPAQDRAAQQNRLMPHLMVYASQNREFGQLWRLRVMAPGRTRLLALLTRAVGRGELPGDLNMEVAVAQLIGPMLFAYMFAALHAALPRNLATHIADGFCRAYATTPAASGRPRAKARSRPPAGTTTPRRRRA